MARPGWSSASASRISFRRGRIGLVTSGRPDTTADGRRLQRAATACPAANRHRLARPSPADSGRAGGHRNRDCIRRERAALLIDAVLLDQGVGDRAGSGAELDDGSGCIRIDILRHRPGQEAARRHDGADVKRLLNPGAEKTDLVVEARRLLLQRTRGRLQRHVDTRRYRVLTAVSGTRHKDV